MTSAPYPSFVKDLPVDEKRAALVAVGKCRIHLESEESYGAIVQKCKEEASAQDDKALAKKCKKAAVAMAKDLLMTKRKLDVSIVQVEIVVSSGHLVETNGCLASCLLDAGCHAIVTSGLDLGALDAAKVPPDRLVTHFELMNKESILAAVPSLASTASVDVEATTIQEVKDVWDTVKDHPVSIVVKSQQFTEMDDLTVKIGELCKGRDGKGTVCLVDPTPEELGLSYAACMRTDRDDGLYTTVVCTRSGEALGLVYSAKESIVASLECGRGVYYSRSRKGLWRKGDSSGMYQILHRMDVDCDGDALRFTVTQCAPPGKAPAFCHLMTLSCWGPPVGLRRLEETLQERLVTATEGSYTQRLFNDSTLLRNKLVEEAQELSESTEKQHVAEELADVIYFAMVRAAKAGVSIDDAAAELDRRARKVTRRKGESKAHRIAAGEEILKNKEKEGSS